MTNFLEKLYFVYSFGYMIFKLVAVSLYGAWINDESKEPVNILNSIPSSDYNNEVNIIRKWKLFSK